MHALELKNVYKSYNSSMRSIPVLRGLDFQVEPGEFVAVIGASGQGKSTLLNILGCLDRPDIGEYRVFGESVDWHSKGQLSFLRGNRIATIFQGYELISHWTVLENAEICLRFRGMEAKKRKMKALNALQQVNLLQDANKYPHELSGGEQQRVAIARALCAEPAILLADEPTGNLDPQTAAKVMNLLWEMNQKGVTIIFVTHDMQLAQVAHRVARLQDGQIEWWTEEHVERQHS